MNFTELTRKKMSAVVQVYVEGYVGEDVKCILNPRLGDLNEWTGSGFFVQCEYGEDIIITNSHVVKNAKSIEIMSMLTSGEKFKAHLVGMVNSQEPDVAVLKLDKGEMERFEKISYCEISYLSLSVSDKIYRGAQIKAIGYPMGMSEPNITGGEITNFISGDRVLSEKYVTDAAINPGNSGGPAINQEGLVVGVNTSIYKDADNIGFITPSNFIYIILKNIFENNSICFAEIGGNFQKNSTEVSKNLNMKSPIGIIVSDIEKDGFLDLAGIKKEDVIISLNNGKIDRHGIFISSDYTHRKNIFDAIKLIPIGEEVSLGVWRNKKLIDIKAKSMAYPQKKIEDKPIIKERRFLDIWGMTIQVLSYEIIESYNLIDSYVFYHLLKNYNENKERLIVTHIKKEGEAYLQEWSHGEVIFEVNDEEVESMEHLISIIKDHDKVAKLKTELGTLGYFDCSLTKEDLILLSPSKFLE